MTVRSGSATPQTMGGGGVVETKNLPLISLVALQNLAALS